MIWRKVVLAMIPSSAANILLIAPIDSYISLCIVSHSHAGVYSHPFPSCSFSKQQLFPSSNNFLKYTLQLSIPVEYFLPHHLCALPSLVLSIISFLYKRPSSYEQNLSKYFFQHLLMYISILFSSFYYGFTFILCSTFKIPFPDFSLITLWISSVDWAILVLGFLKPRRQHLTICVLSSSSWYLSSISLGNLDLFLFFLPLLGNKWLSFYSLLVGFYGIFSGYGIFLICLYFAISFFSYFNFETALYSLFCRQ